MEQEPVSCPQCGIDLPNYMDLGEHAKLCPGVEEAKVEEEARRQDAENNNSLEESDEPPAMFPYSSPSHVTLEALQNTKVAVAQFAATAMANNADNPAALQELAVLQSTLYTLQHQQMMQLNLIQQLQQQLQIGRPKDLSPPPQQQPLLPQPKESRSPTPVKPDRDSPPIAAPTPPAPAPPPLPSPPASLPPCSISSSFASSIITNLDPPPSPSEPNTLEMLQRRAQEVLDNASQGLLANNLADELAFRKNGSKGSMSPYDSKTGGRNEPFFKHRCRYCGKVFGSDSALQIHIRSHTGERPFKCNVCGSRFTTKGNLKVHFQRHSAKFPHIKMNPNPIPEHLDKYHPPLLAQMGAHQSLPPGPPPFPPQFNPLYRPPHDLVLPPQSRTHEPVSKSLLPVSMFGPRIEQDVPENLSSKAQSEDCGSGEDMYKKEPTDDEIESGRLSPKRELEADTEMERYPSPSGYDDGSLDSKYTGDDIPGDRDSPGLEKNEDSFQDQPENLSNKMNGDKSPGGSPSDSETPSLQLTQSPAASECSSLGALDLTGSRSSSIFPGFFPPPASGPPPPASFTSALSSLTSSVLTTTAFNPLGLAVGPPVRGNTTCNLCFKTFACNSALEIHYRSHTKERPFKCTICDRGFSTKGNMKQHMLTHKIRDMPPHLFEQKGGPGSVSSMIGSGEETSSDQQLQHSPVQLQSSPAQLQPPHSQSGPQPQHQQLQGPPPQSQQLQASQPSPQQQAPPPPPPQLQPSPHLQPQPQSTPLPRTLSPAPPSKPEIGVKRSPPQSDTNSMPLPKRQPSLPKHLCHVCNKNFSSSSALQIHMRTHTGDKPFRCSICHKAFTTKGNLKVHMGTHMWTNGASRRGRRMSLELPQLPKDSEFLHRRPDLFYPYLPAPFLNGIHHKLSEMPMGQGGGGGGGGSHNGLLPFGGFPGADMKAEPRSPPEKPPPPHSTPPSLWELHFERKAEEQAMPPPRGEGLAA